MTSLPGKHQGKTKGNGKEGKEREKRKKEWMGTTHYSFVLRIELAIAPIYGNVVFAGGTPGKGCKEKDKEKERKGKERRKKRKGKGRRRERKQGKGERK